jgi:hypothetical protein
MVGEGLGLTEVGQSARGLAELEEGPPQLEAEIDGLLERVARLGELPQGRESLLDVGDSFAIGRPSLRPGAGPVEIRDRPASQRCPWRAWWAHARLKT